MANYDTNRRNQDRTYTIELTDKSKKLLIQTMKEELNYYNTLVFGSNSKIRTLVNEIDQIKDNYEKLWLAVAQTETDLRLLVTKPLDNWPEIFRPFSDMIVKNNRLIITDRMMILFDIAATKSNINSIMRRLIAMEVLHWIQPQAKQLAESDLSVTGQMRTPIQMLQPTDFMFKRHIQLISGLTKLTYNKELNQSILTIPYTSDALIIENNDLTKLPHSYFIIRQKFGEVPTSDTIWQLTVKENNSKYLLDLIDMSYVRKQKRHK
jgi:hypothetical protein